MIPVIGQKVKLYEWTGVVLNVLKSPNGNIAVRFFFVKNAFKAQFGGELHEFTPEETERIKPATDEEIAAEIAQMHAMTDKYIGKYIGIKASPKPDFPKQE